jgi:hypothetical protein
MTASSIDVIAAAKVNMLQFFRFEADTIPFASSLLTLD